MPDAPNPEDPKPLDLPPTDARDVARGLARGVARWLADLGYESLSEFRLINGRRADVAGIDKAARFVIVEIKSSEADFRADGKWEEYLPYCDAFYFAVPEGFPQEILPDGHGILAADAFGAAIVRESLDGGMNGARRNAQIRRFALAAAARLRAVTDPRVG